MKNQFVPYELAVKLKELGFNDTVRLAFYIKEGDIPFSKTLHRYNQIHHFIPEYCIAAPLWQQAFDWFREEGVISWIDRNDNTFRYNIEFSNGSILGLQGFVTYEEARLACLEKLIELAS